MEHCAAVRRQWCAQPIIGFSEDSMRLPGGRTPGAHYQLDRHTACSHAASEVRVMSLVRLLGFRTLACGCVIGRYRELATSRELTYIEEKGPACEMYGHRRNHTIAADRTSIAPEPLSAARVG
jgi:hypothetical protein